MTKAQVEDHVGAAPPAVVAGVNTTAATETVRVIMAPGETVVGPLVYFSLAFPFLAVSSLWTTIKGLHNAARLRP